MIENYADSEMQKMTWNLALHLQTLMIRNHKVTEEREWCFLRAQKNLLKIILCLYDFFFFAQIQKILFIYPVLTKMLWKAKPTFS